MNLEQIVSELKQRGVATTTAKIETFLNQAKIDPADVTPAVIDAIAKQLQPSALATAPKSGKVTKPKNKRSTRGDRTKTIATELGQALGVASQSTNTELDAIASTIETGLEAYESAKAEDIVDRVREVPLNVLSKVAQLAVEEEANPQMFRTEIGSIMQQLGFGTGDDAESNGVETGSHLASR